MQQDHRVLRRAGPAVLNPASTNEADPRRDGAAGPGTADAPALCSRLSAERGLELIGSAGCYDRVVAFELDSPWTPRLAGSRGCDEALDAAIAEIATLPGVRLLALEPRGDAHQGRRVLCFSRPPGLFGGYDRREFVVDRGRLGEALIALARAQAGQAVGDEVVDEGPVRDLLVCTHGSRDACCAKFGYPTFLRFEELAALRQDGSPKQGRVRVWRSSHLGGHRFAPTLLDLPSGRMFGRLEEGDAALVLEGGEALLPRLASIYRGCCALPEEVQIVERRLWQESGAGFEAASLAWECEDVPRDSGPRAVRLEAHLDAEAEGSSVSSGPRWSAGARVVRDEIEAVTTPASCGRDPETESPWRILP